MELPVIGFEIMGPTYGRRDSISKPKAAAPLDSLIDPTPFIEETWAELSGASDTEAAKLNAYNREAKLEPERRLDTLQRQIQEAESALAQATEVTTKLEAHRHRGRERPFGRPPAQIPAGTL
jgi:hypothetical protein